jgi:hypothetical protein
MAATKKTAKMGRPKAVIDLALAEELGQIHCTLSECAAVLGVAEKTLSNRADFLQVYKRGKEDGKASLRRMQLKAAKGGNVSMMIWLGKQLLGQREAPENGHEKQAAMTTWHGLDDLAKSIFGDKYQITDFHRWLLSTLSKFVVDYRMGMAPHLHISLPPQHGKSEAVRMAVAWAVSMCPKTRTAWASYNSTKAGQSARYVRDWLQEHRPELFDRRSKTTEKEWSLTNGSTMIGCGIDGQLVGEPVNLLVLDDLLKNYVEYCSKTHREKIRYWLKSVVQSRTNNQTAILSIGTRWGQDDAIDLLMQEVPEKWQVYAIPAVAGEDDPIGRAPGEVLWADRHSKELLTRKMDAAGPIIRAAVYQQAPLQVSGLFFKRDKWESWNQERDSATDRTMVCRYWDLAFTKDGHGTAGALGYIKNNTDFVIEDLQVVRQEWPVAKEFIIKQALKDGKEVVVGIEGNGTQIGYYQEVSTDPKMKGFRVVRRKAKPDKTDDARAWQSLQWGGKVFLGTVNNLIDRAERFPENDIDEIDAISGLFWLSRLHAKHLSGLEVY